jgi:hypothetical protein
VVDRVGLGPELDWDVELECVAVDLGPNLCGKVEEGQSLRVLVGKVSVWIIMEGYWVLPSCERTSSPRI